MPPLLQRLQTLRISRSAYLAIGLLSFALKFAIDWLVATYLFHRSWSPAAYLLSARYYEVWSSAQGDRQFLLTLLALSLPFMVIGVAATLGRMRDAGLSLWGALFFFVPAVNLAFFALLLAIPTAQTEPPIDASDSDDVETDDRDSPPVDVSRISWRTVAITSLLATAIAALPLFGLRYGWGIFVILPVFMGVLCVVCDPAQPGLFARAVHHLTISMACSGVFLVAFALEGAICLLMAAPIAYVMGLAGICVAQFALWGVEVSRRRLNAAGASILALCLAQDAWVPGPIPTVAVTSAITVQAPPEVVWGYVVAFPALAPPTEWYFKTGVAYPISATISGRGPGAIRRCEFSTGAFVEPIEVWDEPRRLAFTVASQPPPMRELSIYSDIKAPHLSGYLQSKRGQFVLVDLGNGTTRLEGTTWLENQMWPQAYWNGWISAIIHRIHLRVLQHIAHCAESSARTTP